MLFIAHLGTAKHLKKESNVNFFFLENHFNVQPLYIAKAVSNHELKVFIDKLIKS